MDSYKKQEKRIYKNMYLLAVISVLLTTLLLLISFYNLFNNEVRNEIKSKADFLRKSLNSIEDKSNYLKSLELDNSDTRVTIINSNKAIIFDSYTEKDRENLKEYIDNKAIDEAAQNGSGEHKHLSNTFNSEIYYYAVKLDDGTILCLSQNTNGVYSVFISILPIILLISILIFAICNVLAVKMIKERTRAEKMRREFSANVSHELKTPLTIIYGYADMISSGIVKQEDIKGSVLKIKNESARVINLVEDIIRVSEWDEGVAKRQKEKFNLVELSKETINSLENVAKNMNIEIKLISESSDIIINANKNMIHELIFNLLENSVKYNKENGSVILRLSIQKNKTIIQVEDTGIGIPKKYHDRVFERFFRVDKSRSKKTGGTGLGLSIVKHIVGYHKGKIKIESEEDIGTKITIIL